MYLVQKYGGDYLKNNEDLTKIADYVANHREQLGQLGQQWHGLGIRLVISY